MRLKKVFALAGLLSLAAATYDGMSHKGEYGGAALDSLGLNGSANIYRTIGKAGYGTGEFLKAIWRHTSKQWGEFFDYYGKPSP